MFISKDFTFNGETNEQHGVWLVTFDNDILLKSGNTWSRTIRDESSSVYNPMYLEEKEETEEVTLNLISIDENGVLTPWTDDKIKNVTDWLICNDFAPFISNDNPDYTYYFLCTKIERKFTANKLGVLEVTFRPFSNYAYKKVVSVITVNNETKNIIINNPSNMIYKPIVEITNKGVITSINKVDSFEITGLVYDETAIVDNLMLTVLNSNGENKFDKCNRGWIELVPGNNTITISGQCSVRIVCEYPYVM